MEKYTQHSLLNTGGKNQALQVESSDVQSTSDKAGSRWQDPCTTLLGAAGAFRTVRVHSQVQRDQEEEQKREEAPGSSAAPGEAGW